MTAECFNIMDLYNVCQARAELLRKTAHAHFCVWWDRFTAARDRFSQSSEASGRPSAAGSGGEGAYQFLEAAGREMLAQSFAYALTHEARFAEQAIELAELVCGVDDWLNPRHEDIYPELRADLGFATLCIQLAASLGWLQDVLARDQKRLLLDTLHDRGRVIYEDTLSGAWWGDAPNSNWTSHLMHGLGSAGLALWTYKPDAARSWVALVTERMRRMLDLAADEGAGIEGIGYFMGCYASILEYGTELRNVVGEDLFDHPFWARCSLFPLYHTLPDLSGRTPVGDTHYPGLTGSTLLAGVAREARDGIAQWQVHRIFERVDLERLSIWDLLFYDPSVQETLPDSLPPCRVFHSVQIASFRSGWDADAVYLHFHGGSNTWSHCHLDLNSFTLAAYGERLAIDHGSWGYTPHYFRVVEPQISTAWHNCVVVDGADQRQAPRYRMSYDPTEGGECYSLLGDHYSCAGAIVIRGDATLAYADMLDRCWRDVVYLKPDRFVIYDRLIANGARVQRHIQWLLHSQMPMVDLGSRVEIRGEKATLVVQPVLPVGWRCRFPDRLARVHAQGTAELRESHCLSIYPEWVHIWNESPAKPPYPQWDARGGERVYGPDYQFLVVLSPVKAGAALEWAVERLQGNGVDGVRIREGDAVDTVLFKRFGGTYALAGVSSDADTVVLRQKKGELTSWVMVRGTHLDVGGQYVVRETSPVSMAQDL